MLGPLPLRTLGLVWLALVGVSVAVGSQMPGATSYDHDISVRFADARTSALDKVTAVTSGLASTFVVIAIAFLVVAVGILRHRVAGVVLVVLAMAGEVTMFLMITLLVDRSRPDVAQLDPAPPTSSFPSGHVLASFVMWNAIAVLAVEQDWSSVWRRIARFLAIAMPVAVGVSRIYRGMHHPTDVLASFVIGVIWMLAIVLVVRPDAIGGARSWRRSARSDPPVQSDADREAAVT